MSQTLQGMKSDAEVYEDYRYLHSRVFLKIGAWDAFKLFWGALWETGLGLRASLCFRLCIYKDSDEELEQNGPGRPRISNDLYSTRWQLMKVDQTPEATSEAKFNYQELHNKQ